MLIEVTHIVHALLHAVLLIGVVFGASNAIAIANAHDNNNTTTIEQQLNAFALKFWEWRSIHAPITSDDLPRTAVVRPDGWGAVNVSASGLLQQQLEYEDFVAELAQIRDTTNANFNGNANAKANANANANANGNPDDDGVSDAWRTLAANRLPRKLQQVR